MIAALLPLHHSSILRGLRAGYRSAVSGSFAIEKKLSLHGIFIFICMYMRHSEMVWIGADDDSCALPEQHVKVAALCSHLVALP